MGCVKDNIDLVNIAFEKTRTNMARLYAPLFASDVDATTTACLQTHRNLTSFALCSELCR